MTGCVLNTFEIYIYICVNTLGCSYLIFCQSSVLLMCYKICLWHIFILQLILKLWHLNIKTKYSWSVGSCKIQCKSIVLTPIAWFTKQKNLILKTHIIHLSNMFVKVVFHEYLFTSIWTFIHMFSVRWTFSIIWLIKIYTFISQHTYKLNKRYIVCRAYYMNTYSCFKIQSLIELPYLLKKNRMIILFQGNIY